MILVTGGTGLIGRAVAKRLLSSGHAIRLQVRSRRSLNDLDSNDAPLPSEIQEVDFLAAEESRLDQLVAGCHTVVHTAALVHNPAAASTDYELINVRATQLLAERHAIQKGTTFVFFSSMAVYGEGMLEEVPESAPLNAVSPYGLSKQISESWLSSSHPVPRIIVLRPALVYGAGDRGNLLKLIRQINKGRYVHIGKETALKSIIHADDLALAVELCLARLDNGCHVLNVANEQAVSLRQLTETIAACCGRMSIPELPLWLLQWGATGATWLLGKRSPLTPEQLAKLTTTTTLSVRKLAALTAFRSKISLKDGVASEISWAKQSKLI